MSSSQGEPLASSCQLHVEIELITFIMKDTLLDIIMTAIFVAAKIIGG